MSRYAYGLRTALLALLEPARELGYKRLAAG